MMPNYKRDYKNQAGFAHWIVPALVVAVVSVIGVKMLTFSSAATNTIAIISPATATNVFGAKEIIAQVTSKRTTKSVVFMANNKPIIDAGTVKCHPSGQPQPQLVPGAHAICWDASALAGPYEITAKVTFMNGKDALSPAITLIANHGDPVPQSITIVQPASGTTVHGYLPITAKTTASASSVSFYANGKGISDAGTSKCFSGPVPQLAPNTYLTCWDSTSTTGTVKLVAVAYDAAQSRTTSAPVSVVVANLVPTP